MNAADLGEALTPRETPLPSAGEKARGQLVLAMIFCFLFMILEVIGGYVSGSLAIMTDAAHLLSDVLAFLISLFAVWISQRPSSGAYTWGYHRWELIGACLSVFLIWLLTALLCMEAVNRIIHPEPLNGLVMFITATAGLLVNLGMMKILHQGGSHHGHSHAGGGGHSHGDHENLNVRAAFIHVVGDLVQSVGVMIASVIIWIVPEAHIADPICTFLFSILVLFTTVGILRSAAGSALNMAPAHVNLLDLTRDFLGLKGITRVYGLHVWEYGGSGDREKVALEVHLVTNEDSNVTLSAALGIAERHGCTHPTIQVETAEQAGLSFLDRTGATLDLYEHGGGPRSSWLLDLMEAVSGIKFQRSGVSRPVYHLEPPHSSPKIGPGQFCSGHGHGGGHSHGSSGHGHGGHSHGSSGDGFAPQSSSEAGEAVPSSHGNTFKGTRGLSLKF